MNNPDNVLQKPSNYRWFILSIAFLISLIVVGTNMLIPAFSFVIVPDLHLTIAQFLLLVSASRVAGIFGSVPSGLIGDRYGIRLAVGLGTVIAGSLGLLIAFNSSFGILFTIICCTGLGSGLIMSNLPKVIGNWFPPRQMGLASGIYNAGLTLGVTFVFATSIPLYGSNWRIAFKVMSSISLIIGIIWWIFARNRPKGTKQLPVKSPLPGLTAGIKSKNIWILGLLYAVYYINTTTFSGLLPRALGQVYSVTPATASLLMTIFSLATVIGHLIFSTLSDRFGLRKPFIIIGALVCAVFLLIGWNTAFNSWTLVYFALCGIGQGALPALIMAIPIELPEIGNQYVASAAGVVVSLGNTGAFLIPSFLIPALATPDMKLTFWVLAGITVLGVVMATLLSETGMRNKPIIRKAVNSNVSI